MDSPCAFSVGSLKAWRHPAPAARARLLLVHGLGEHSARYLRFLRALGERGLETIRFDLRGAGESGGERMWIERFSDYTDDVAAIATHVRNELEPLPLFLYGHSLGGAIAIRFASQHPTGLTGLVLSAPAFRQGRGVSALKIALGKRLARLLPHVRIPGSLDTAALSRDPQVIRAYQRDPLNCRFNTVRQGAEILAAMERLASDAQRITLPVLIVHGDADRIIRVEGSRELLQAFASADKTLRVFPGGYHEPHNDLDQTLVVEVVADWLLRHCGDAGH